MNEIIIRKAEIKDLPVLREFEQGVISAERPFDATLKPDPNYYYDIDEMIAANHIELLVAEKENKLIASGYARIEEAKPYLQHRQHAYLGFMYVEPGHRGQGVNKMILDALEKWVLSKGIAELRLDVYHPNDAAIRAYEKVGFTRHMIEMRKAIQG